MTTFIAPIVAILFAAASAVAWGALYVGIMDGAAAVSAARTEAAAAASRDALARSAAQFVAETADEQLAAASLTIPAAATAQAIELVEAAARRTKVTATVTTAQIESLANAHERLIVTVAARGAFTDLIRFASFLEALPVASSVSMARLEATDTGWQGTVTVAFIKQIEP